MVEMIKTTKTQFAHGYYQFYICITIQMIASRPINT